MSESTTRQSLLAELDKVESVILETTQLLKSDFEDEVTFQGNHVTTECESPSHLGGQGNDIWKDCIMRSVKCYTDCKSRGGTVSSVSTLRLCLVLPEPHQRTRKRTTKHHLRVRKLSRLIIIFVSFIGILVGPLVIIFIHHTKHKSRITSTFHCQHNLPCVPLFPLAQTL
jgi:hypothetical protein